MKFRIRSLRQFNTFNFCSINKLNKSKIKFEDRSEIFWNNKTPQIDSMCGIGELNEEDLIHSEGIFQKVKPNTKFNRALDVGAGIGRITFNVLYNKSDKIDMLDINKAFLDYAHIKEKEMKGNKIDNLYHSKIQNFKFEYTYDLIFVQWVLEYLNEENLVKFLSNISINLKDEGCVIIKENVNLNNESNILIEEEGSLIRPTKSYENAFKFAGLNLIHDELVKYKSVQDEIYDVKCWVLEKY